MGGQPRGQRPDGHPAGRRQHRGQTVRDQREGRACGAPCRPASARTARPASSRRSRWPSRSCATRRRRRRSTCSATARCRSSTSSRTRRCRSSSSRRQGRQQPRHHRAGCARQSRGRPPARHLCQRGQLLHQQHADRAGTAARRPPARNAPADHPAGRDFAPGLSRRPSRATASSPCA